MRGLFNRFANFMQGRYGTDKLNNALWVLLLILWFVNILCGTVLQDTSLTE